MARLSFAQPVRGGAVPVLEGRGGRCSGWRGRGPGWLGRTVTQCWKGHGGVVPWLKGVWGRLPGLGCACGRCPGWRGRGAVPRLEDEGGGARAGGSVGGRCSGWRGRGGALSMLEGAGGCAQAGMGRRGGRGPGCERWGGSTVGPAGSWGVPATQPVFTLFLACLRRGARAPLWPGRL